MKKIFTLFALLAMFAFASCSYDDTEILGRVDTLEEEVGALEEDVTSIEERLKALEEQCKQMNTNILSLQTIIAALQSNDYITNISTLTDSMGVTIGYTITFSKSGAVTIYHGENGKDGADGQDGLDGYSPQIGVAKDVDNIYYWTLDGEWMLDADGNKIKAEGIDGKDGQDGANGTDGSDGANGNDGATGPQGPQGDKGDDGATGPQGPQGEQGITPLLKIENSYWYISYDNGASWDVLGKAVGAQGPQGEQGEQGEQGATGAQGPQGEQGEKGDKGDTGAQGPKGERGDSFFLDVSQDEEYVYLTLTNGTLISIPRQRAFTLTFDTEAGTLSFATGEVVSVNYTLSYGYDNTEVRVIGNGGWDVSLTRKSNTTGTISITAPMVNSDAEIVVFATDGIGHSTMATLVCSVTNSGSVLTIINEVINVTEAATQVQVELQTNIDSYDVVIPATAQSWISLDNVVTRAALREDVIKLNIAENTTTSERMAAVGIINTELGITESVLIKQQRGVVTQTITYTSSDEKIVTPYNEYAFGGANIVSNTYENGEGKIIFDGDVTSVGFNAFYNCTTLTSINLPDRVSSIGEYAFSGCTALSDMDFGAGVKSIATLALENCSAIKTLKVPDNITSIATGAFTGCKFVNVILGDGLTTISNELFSGMTSLQMVLFGSNLKTIGSKAFYNCEALRLSEVPVGVTAIESFAFYGCDAISYLSIPEGVTTIRNNAFASCLGLVNVTLPTSIATIEAGAFSGCTKLAVVYCNAITPPTLEDAVFNSNASGRTIYVPQNSIDNYLSATNWEDYGNYITYIGGTLSKVGDLVYTDGWPGVIYYIDDSTTKLVSPTLSTGAVYTAARSFCDNYASGGWYLPSESELKNIYNKLSIVNETLTNYNFNTLKLEEYWTSTLSSSNTYTYYKTVNLKYGSSASGKANDPIRGIEGSKEYVCAIRVF